MNGFSKVLCVLDDEHGQKLIFVHIVLSRLRYSNMLAIQLIDNNSVKKLLVW